MSPPACAGQNGDELAELIVDPWVLEHVKVINHFARNDADHVNLGFTPTLRTPLAEGKQLSIAKRISPAK